MRNKISLLTLVIFGVSMSCSNQKELSLTQRPLLLANDSIRKIPVHSEKGKIIDTAKVYLAIKPHFINKERFYRFSIEFGRNSDFVHARFDSLFISQSGDRLFIAGLYKNQSFFGVLPDKIAVSTICDFSDSIGNKVSLDTTFQIQWSCKWRRLVADEYVIRVFNRNESIEWIELHLKEQELSKLVIADFDPSAIYL